MDIEKRLYSAMARAHIRAKNMTPFDTGNLKFNSLTKRVTKTGAKLYFDGREAYYTTFLQEGWTSKSGKLIDQHKGFIDEIKDIVNPMVLAEIKSKNINKRVGLCNPREFNTNLEFRKNNLGRSRIRFDRDVIMSMKKMG